MKIHKRFFLSISIFIIILLLCTCEISGCKQINKPKLHPITETNKINRLTQNLPLSKDIIQDISVHYKCDLQRTGVFKGENPKLKGDLVWSTDREIQEADLNFIGKQISSPIIFEDILYIGNIDHYIYAIDANTGKFKWSLKTDGSVTSSPALWNRTLYFGSEDGFLYAVDIDSHLLKWKYKTDGPVTSSPAIAEKNVFFGSTDGIFYALDALTGVEKWKFDTKQSITCNPVIVQNYLVDSEYIGYRVFFVSEPKTKNDSSKMFALDLKTGIEIWHLETNKGCCFNNLCISSKYLYVGFYSSSLVGEGGEMFCNGVISVEFTSETGTFLHFYPSHNSDIKKAPYPSCNGNILFFGSFEGIEYAVNIGNTLSYGKEYQNYILYNEYMWEYKVKSYSRREFPNASVDAPPALSGDGNLVYFGDGNGYLHVVETNTGKEILLLSIYMLDEDKFFDLDSTGIVSFPLLYKNKLFLYAHKRYSNSEDNRYFKYVGVLYCIK